MILRVSPFRRIRVSIGVAIIAILSVLMLEPATAQRQDVADLNVKVVQLINAGKNAEALELAQRALALAEKTLSSNDALISQSLNNLAAAHRNLGRYSDAEALHKRGIALDQKIYGPDHPDTASNLNNLGLLYYLQGRYADAEPLFKRAVTVRDKTLKPDDPTTILMVENLASVYEKINRFAEAEAFYKRILNVRGKSLGQNHVDVARTLNNLANVYRSQSRFAETEAAYRRALSIRQAAQGPEHPDVATVLNNIAMNYMAAGRYADAEPLHRNALAMRQKALGADHTDVAVSLNNLASLQERQGRHAEAETLYKRALAIREKASGPDHPEVARLLSNIASFYVGLNRDAESETLQKRALAIREKAFGRNHVDVANSLNNLAVLYENQGRFSEATPLQQRSLAFYETQFGPDHPEVARVVLNLASLYANQGRTADAEALNKRSLAIREKALGPAHPDVAFALNTLGVLYLNQNKIADAEPLFKRALAIDEKALGNSHPSVADALNNLAFVRSSLNDPGAAEPLHRRALAIREKAFGPDHSKVAQSLNNLALLHSNSGRLPEAERLYRRALAIHEKLRGPKHSDVSLTANNLAALLNKQGRYEDALKLVRTASSAGFPNKPVYLSVLINAVNSKNITNADTIAESYFVVQQATSSAASVALSQLSVRSAAGTGPLAELVRLDQDLSAEAETLNKRLDQEIAKLSGQRDQAGEQKIRTRLQDLADRLEQSRARLAREFPDYATLSKPQPLTIAETKALLADDEALVLIDVDNDSHLWVVTRDERRLITIGSGKDIDANARKIRESIGAALGDLGKDRMSAFDTAAAYDIYKATLAKVEELIATKPRLLFVLTGSLTGVPPHILVTSDPAGKDDRSVDWLVRRHEISVFPSVASLKFLRGKESSSRAAKRMMGFANPKFDPAPAESGKRAALSRSLASFYEGSNIDLTALSRSLPPLPETEAELRTVGKTVKAANADLKFGAGATETAVKQAKLNDYQILYFATHALVAGETAQFVKAAAEPAIALSIPSKATEFDDGLLTASEIAQLKMNADWVVLSACNTAAGSSNSPGAEPLSGLARAFFYAGARSLLVSHWEVPSLSAVQLLVGIFDAKAKDAKLTNAGALRQSMLAQLNDARNPGWSHPAHWAPFVLVGESK